MSSSQFQAREEYIKWFSGNSCQDAVEPGILNCQLDHEIGQIWTAAKTNLARADSSRVPGPISSSFVNRFGCRLVTIAGSILGSACLALSVFAPNVVTLYFTVGIGTGVGFGLIYLPAIVSVTCYFEKYRSLATGIAVCGSGLGTFIFAPFIGLLVQRLQWQGAILVIAGFVLCCALFGALFRPLEAEEPPPPPAATQEVALLGPRRRHNGSAADLTAAGGGMLRPLSLSHFTMPRGGGGGGQEASRLALSQPVLGSGRETRPHVFDNHSLKRRNSGIMYRKDIFYRGSLHNIPYHRSAPWLNQDRGSSEESQLVKSCSQDLQAKKKDSVGEETRQVMILGCVPCSQETKDTLREMLDFSLFRDPVFLLFTCSNFLTSIGFNIPYVYIKVQAKEKGISENQGDYLLSVIGIANLVGRIVLGYLSDKPWTNRLLVYNLCLTACGGSIVLVSTLAVYLLSVIGIANLVGRIVLGYLSDKPWTNRLLVYNLCLTACGVVLVSTLAVYLLSVIGIANLVGRIVLGYLSDKPWTNRLLVYNLCLTACGVVLVSTLAVYLLSVIGIANLVGRIVLGYLSDKPWTNRLLVYNLCLTACGVVLVSTLAVYLLSVIGIADLVGRIVLGYLSDKPWTNRLLVYNLCLTACGVVLVSTLAVYLLSVIGIANLVGRIVLGYLSDKPWTNRLLVYNLCLTACGVVLVSTLAVYLLSVIGIANLVGRIVLGYLSDKPWTNRLLVYNLCLTACGLVTMLVARLIILIVGVHVACIN
ncbi:hypothetical protein PR048_030984 [Dryococelus australis]|uniref:Monocarboxylate transporter n=1 Tax=Dryococelus australis TaxID=614101 RepID=A0ABQ9G400_9NEOP|nr:hypothetical protein PR048_030984 [Dryococelus australis]